jgi:preprotein translocase subunit SecF
LTQCRTEKRTKRNEAGIVREEVTYELTKPYEEIVGSAVTQTIARSINTSLTTLLTLGALYVIGGSVTQTFTLVLIAGVLAGTYSSIFIATPLLVAYAKWQESKNK